MATTPDKTETPLTRSQDEIAERLRHWLQLKAVDDNENRDLALVRVIDRDHAAVLMDADTQGQAEVDKLLLDYPDQAPSREKMFQLVLNGQPPELLITLPSVLNRARALHSDLMLLSEYGWVLGRDEVDEGVASAADEALHAGLRGLVAFCQAYGIPVRGDDDLVKVAAEMETA